MRYKFIAASHISFWSIFAFSFFLTDCCWRLIPEIIILFSLNVILCVYVYRCLQQYQICTISIFFGRLKTNFFSFIIFIICIKLFTSFIFIFHFSHFHLRLLNLSTPFFDNNYIFSVIFHIIHARPCENLNGKYILLQKKILRVSEKGGIGGITK